MATWQFAIVLIPRSWAIENQYDSSLLCDEEGYDTEVAWKNNQPKSVLINVLSNLLPPAKSWSKDLKCWGNENEDDIQVWYKNNSLTGIRIRIDLNQKFSGLIVKLVKAAKELDCVLFFPELKSIAEANEFKLKSAIQKSTAAQFVKDPQGFLNELQNKT